MPWKEYSFGIKSYFLRRPTLPKSKFKFKFKCKFKPAEGGCMLKFKSKFKKKRGSKFKVVSTSYF